MDGVQRSGVSMAQRQPVDGFPAGAGTEYFFVGQNEFSQLEVRQSGCNPEFYYFYHVGRRDLITGFVLQDAAQTRRICEVTLIRKKGDEVFTPRLTFKIINKTKKALQEVAEPVIEGETRLIKARVDLSSCHEHFWKLINFLQAFDQVATPEDIMSVVSGSDRALIDEIEKSSKSDVISALLKKHGKGINEADIALLAGRKEALARFESMLADPSTVESLAKASNPNRTIEGVWQDFFQENSWIFGYGLNLLSCEAVDGARLEKIVAGSDSFGAVGKRIDALMKTRGHVSSLLFCEIKKPEAQLLMKSEYRPGVFEPAQDLRGGVAQVQKTIQRVVQQVSQVRKEIVGEGGSPTGEEVAVVQPRGVVVVGMLSEFQEVHGINYERFSSFELHRLGTSGVEIITFDELLERARYIVQTVQSDDATEDEQEGWDF